VATAIGDEVFTKFPFLDGVEPVSGDPVDCILSRTWRPTLSVTGADGLPPVGSAGNVLRAETALKLSLRLPPTVDHAVALDAVQRVLLADPPYGAHVHVEHAEGASGWNAPTLSPWLDAALQRASEAYFGKPALHMGEGGSIPFMGMLGEKFPQAQFVITGVLGPGSNAHGPNEFLHIPMGKKLTACVASVLADHAQRGR
jgi:acetylornithine deacetylase/succinyl-diaminopimelate desuccinylase-like protein